ncbi:unnamed protein product, partial [Amoebophrya sp. A25]
DPTAAPGQVCSHKCEATRRDSYLAGLLFVDICFFGFSSYNSARPHPVFMPQECCAECFHSFIGQKVI